MSYPNSVYSFLLNNVFWSILPPALPGGGGAGTAPTGPVRQTVGVPEHIPERTFISGPVGTDGFLVPAREFHATYNLTPTEVISMEELVNDLKTGTGVINRMRIVSHADHNNIYFKFFTAFGAADRGITQEQLAGFGHSDERGLRGMIGNSITESPLMSDNVSRIFNGIRSLNSAILQPMGLHNVTSTLSGDNQSYFEIINDLFFLQKDGLFTFNNNHLTTVQRTNLANALSTSLGLIETAIRNRMANATGSTITSTQLITIRDAVLAEPPKKLGLGDTFTFQSPQFLTQLQTVLAGANPTEADLRDAIIGDSTQTPLFLNYADRILETLRRVNRPVLTPLGLQSNAPTGNVLKFFQICNDLHFLEHNRLLVGGSLISGADQATLQQGLDAIANIVRNQAGSTATRRQQLDNLRAAIVQLSPGQLGKLGTINFSDDSIIRQLNAANTALQGTFRADLNLVKARFNGSSTIDIRGCRVGTANDFLRAVAAFFGGTGGHPTVSAPRWFQKFDGGFMFLNTGLANIDSLTTTNIGSGATAITTGDISSALTEWQRLNNFAPHFQFIKGVFDGAPLDFASLEWRRWRSGTAITGIPSLNMLARLIDDIATLTAGDIIARFATMFELSSPPSAAVRTKLDQLQPHIAQFKQFEPAIMQPPAGSALEQDDFTRLNTLADAITAIQAPATPLKPAELPGTLTIAHMQTFATNIRTHLESILTADLGAFFTAIRAAFSHANAEIRYYFLIGLPLLAQSSNRPLSFRVIVHGGNPERDTHFKSWMKIQWTSTNPAVVTAMNTHIDGLALNWSNSTQFRVSMVVEDRTDATAAAISPTTDFSNRINTISTP